MSFVKLSTTPVNKTHIKCTVTLQADDMCIPPSKLLIVSNERFTAWNVLTDVDHMEMFNNIRLSPTAETSFVFTLGRLSYDDTVQVFECTIPAIHSVATTYLKGTLVVDDVVVATNTLQICV
jgi:hypothetical protein